jgi:nucleotide-binding universal stress UspA family protein
MFGGVVVKRIVVGVDGSETSRAALDWAFAEAKQHGVALHILEALDFTSVGEAAASLSAKAREEDLKEKERLLDDLAAGLSGQGVDVTTELALEGPGPALVGAVGPEDLLVVGATGHGLVARAVLGSVSSWVSRHAPCPVTVVPDR